MDFNDFNSHKKKIIEKSYVFKNTRYTSGLEIKLIAGTVDCVNTAACYLQLNNSTYLRILMKYKITLIKQSRIIFRYIEINSYTHTASISTNTQFNSIQMTQ